MTPDATHPCRGVAGAAALATALIVGVSRLADGQRLRVAAEDAGLYALGAMIVTVPLLLAWAVLTGPEPRPRVD